MRIFAANKSNIFVFQFNQADKFSNRPHAQQMKRFIRGGHLIYQLKLGYALSMT